MKSKNVLFSMKKLKRFPGLNIVLPGGVSEETRNYSRALGENNLAKQGKILKANRPANAKVAILERQLANLVKGREFVIEKLPHRQNKIILSSGDGKRLIICEVSRSGEKRDIIDLGDFARLVTIAARQAGL